MQAAKAEFAVSAEGWLATYAMADTSDESNIVVMVTNESAGTRLPMGATAGNLLLLIAPLIGIAGIRQARAHRAQAGKRRRD